MDAPERYRVALLDWLACAAGGSTQPAARAARSAGDGLLERVTWAGCAGHVLDYDDTYSPGLVHASAPVAPVALLLGAELERDIDAVLDAYAAGFEATAALARTGHPELYERGWHPTAVCGTAGAAVAAARLMDPVRGAHGPRDRARAAARRRACAPPSAPTARRCRSGWPPPRDCTPPGSRRPVPACRSLRSRRARPGSRACSAPRGRRRPGTRPCTTTGSRPTRAAWRPTA